MLDLVDLHKSYGAKAAVRGVSLSVAPGEVVAVLGPSGCGKSTLLALTAGLETPDSGDVRWAGESVLTTATHLRGFGLMFQDYALFPHRDVHANVAFGLRMQNQPADVIAARVAQALEVVGLSGYDRRTVTTLSGGEQQRVALARALAPRPRVLMLDEPLGALDRALREQLVEEIGRILHAWEGRPAVIYVTHDQAEAFALAERVAVMRAGRIEQLDTPEALVHEPLNAFVAEFLGLGTLIPARLVAADQVETAWGRWLIARTTAAIGSAGHLVIRTDAAADRREVATGPNLTGRVAGRLPQSLGVRLVLTVANGPEPIDVSLSVRPERAAPIGQTVSLTLDPERLYFIAETPDADQGTVSGSGPAPRSHVQA